MKLLLDANLSWKMIAVLQQHFEDCFHVDHIGNQSRLYITNLLIQRKEEILALSKSSEFGLPEIVSK